MKNKIKVSFLGGVGEIGKNLTVIEDDKSIILIDCGVMFADYTTPGIDLIIPDFTYLEKNKDKIKAIIVTHGHEDHIGAIPYFFKKVGNVKIYSSKLSSLLIKDKLEQHKLSTKKLKVVTDLQKVQIGGFEVQFISANHSIAGSFSLSIKTSQGIIFHSGDFKIDYTPINGKVCNLSKLSTLGDKGVLLMLADSTNVEKSGHTTSESKLAVGLETIFSQNEKKRIIISSFASNVNRMQQIFDICERVGRKVYLYGMSMEKIYHLATESGDLVVNKNLVVSSEENVNSYSDDKVCIICTGSQGEVNAALSRMTRTERAKTNIRENDVVVFSARAIEGNEKTVYNLINDIYRAGGSVVYNTLSQIHVSGHAYQEELKLLHTLIKPKFFIPVHGEYRHLKQHATLAMDLGLNKKNIAICEIGSCVSFKNNQMKIEEDVEAGRHLVDGSLIEDDSSNLIKERIMLSKDGVIVVLITFSDKKSKFCDVDLFTRGITIDDKVIDTIKHLIKIEISNLSSKEIKIKELVEKKINKIVITKTIKRGSHWPVIVPIVNY